MTRTGESRTTHRHLGAAWLLVGALVSVLPSGASAGQTLAQKCSVAKSKAAAKKFGAKLKCYQKAVKTGAPVDPICLGAAETKFNTAIAQAEAAGGCVVSGDGATIEAAVDACVASIVTLTPAATTSTTVAGATTTSTTTTSTTTTLPSLCCAWTTAPPLPFTGCSMVHTASACTNNRGSVASGVCRNDGTCGTATGPGECCSGQGIAVGGGACFVATGTNTGPLCADGGWSDVTGHCTADGCR